MGQTKPVVSGKLQPKPNNSFKKFLLTVMLGALLMGGAIIYWHYFYPFHKGYDKGVLLRFSQQRDLFSTCEGVLDHRAVQSGYSDADTLFFSVTDTALTRALEKVVGKKVLVHYDQYHGPIPWRGNNYNGQNLIDGQYVIDSLIRTEDSTATDF